MRISDWSSDVCSSDLLPPERPDFLGDRVFKPVAQTIITAMAAALLGGQTRQQDASGIQVAIGNAAGLFEIGLEEITRTGGLPPRGKKVRDQRNRHRGHENDLLPGRSEEHTYEVQTLR